MLSAVHNNIAFLLRSAHVADCSQQLATSLHTPYGTSYIVMLPTLYSAVCQCQSRETCGWDARLQTLSY